MATDYPYPCKLLNGAEVLDGSCRCTFRQLSRRTPLGGEFSGEGSIRLSTPWPFTLRAKEPQAFTLRFERLVIPGVGELGDLPILLVPAEAFGSTTVSFKIGTA